MNFQAVSLGSGLPWLLSEPPGPTWPGPESLLGEQVLSEQTGPEASLGRRERKAKASPSVPPDTGFVGEMSASGGGRGEDAGSATPVSPRVLG